MDTELTPVEILQLQSGRLVDKDFFYIPVFYFNEFDDDHVDWHWYSLRFEGVNTRQSLTAYASKVPASTSLKQVIIRDLKQDFHYPHDQTFVIGGILSYDTAQNRKGQTLTRVLVYVGLDYKINPRSTHPLDMDVYWQEEGTASHNMIKEYFEGEPEELYHTQSYVHYPMDGSPPTDPALGRKDEYHFQDGSSSKGKPAVWYE
jgi:hypothetical protein